MSSRIDELDAIVRQFDLNEHPFYTEWRAGTLPVERLAEYADEWAPFISVVDQGWERIGYPGYAAEEREHDALWSPLPGRARRDRRDAAARSPGRCLPSVSRRLHRSPSRSARSTASRSSSRSRRRASWPDCASTTPARSTPMPSSTSSSTRSRPMSRPCWPSLIEGLSDGEFARAKTACAIFSAAAWGALDGVYYTD